MCDDSLVIFLLKILKVYRYQATRRYNYYLTDVRFFPVAGSGNGVMCNGSRRNGEGGTMISAIEKDVFQLKE